MLPKKKVCTFSYVFNYIVRISVVDLRYWHLYSINEIFFFWNLDITFRGNWRRRRESVRTSQPKIKIYVHICMYLILDHVNTHYRNECTSLSRILVPPYRWKKFNSSPTCSWPSDLGGRVDSSGDPRGRDPSRSRVDSRARCGPTIYMVLLLTINIKRPIEGYLKV